MFSLNDPVMYPETPFPADYDYPSDRPFRRPVAKLAQMITDNYPYHFGILPITQKSPEYWGVAAMCPTDEMCEIALKMGKRKPRTISWLVKHTGKTEAQLLPILEQMSYTGILEWNFENPQKEKQWFVPMFVVGSGEYSVMNRELLDRHPENAVFFERMTRKPLELVLQFAPEGGGGVAMHTIPVEKAIDINNKSVSVEHISHWLDKADGRFAACPCVCRLSRQFYGEGGEDDTNDWCLALGDFADYCVETKGARYITREETMEILQKAEDNGFVHQISNVDGKDLVVFICNCNLDTCYALRSSQLFNIPNASRSAYVARVTESNCVACGKCAEVCPAGAAKLGQKLCKEDGTKVEYPKARTPDDSIWWTKKNWTINYRDMNRINCYETGTAPCKTACPAHIGIQGYIEMAKEGRYEEALALIKQDNPFPAICGRICNKRCEAACTRGTIDEAVAIDEIKRFIADRDLKADTRYIPKKKVAKVVGEFDQKIAIIGAGPAGLSCAYFLALRGYKPTIFEKNENPGGMLRYGIPSFKLEKNVIDAEIDVIKALGAEIKCGVEVGKDVTLDELRAQGYKAFYVAIGCQGGRKAGIPGEDAEGVYTAVDFLRETGANESFPLTGDVVVVGGGNVAIDVARVSTRCGKGKVSMFCLESAAEMPASPDEVAEANEEGITINNSWGPKEILTENGKVTGVVFKKCVSVFDADRKFSPKYDENETITVPCSHVVLSVGQAIVWGDLLKGSKVELGRGNAAVANKLTYQTAQPDIFVGGDVYTGPKFAIDAIAAGREGAISIQRFVQPNSSLTIGRDRREYIELDKNDFSIQNYNRFQRQKPGVDAAIAAKKDFRDPSLALTEEQIKLEAARCLSCGASVVDSNRCIGCGLCTTRCEFDAIKLYRERPKASRMYKFEQKVPLYAAHGVPRVVKNLVKAGANTAIKIVKK